MNTIQEREVTILAESVSNDPLKMTLIRRGITNIINNISGVSNDEVIQLLTLQDIDFSMRFGNAIAERHMLQTHSEVVDSSIKKNKMIQKFLESLKEHGGGYTSMQLAEKLEVSKQAISNKKSREQLFYVKVGGQTYFPTFQFSDEKKVSSAFKKVLTILANKDRVSSFFFFTQKLEDRNGNLKPIYKILRGEKQPRYIYEQIEKRARSIHSMGERK
ncbi:MULTISPECIES: hypothetical protein [unclassified Pseudoalteromonas]|uniref:hypothetical protein n=1 Tax=unclassified Pseudoalteromonas TaxID=194690 RepID=UPI0005A662D2|nr:MULTISPECIES: hypothetical protein [unclassified Pseudoalteromonas]